jgi:large subunit ribosomal protein L24
MAAAKIKKGDRVIILSGKDKGRTGDVTQAMPKDGKVVVSGMNVHVRHTKASQADPQGGLKRIEAPMHVSKVAHVTKDGKPTRVRFETGKDGKKVRVMVKSGEKIDG